MMGERRGGIMKLSTISWGLLVALSALAATSARATTLVHQDVAGLVGGSSDIVVGRVNTVHSRWDEYHQHIVTDVTVEVSESLMGERRRLTLTQLGGEVDGIRVTIPASPVFRPGEEALLFVWRDSRQQAQVNGLGQGKFDISRDPVTHERLVSRRLPGLEIGDLRTLRPPRPGKPEARVPLDHMVREIRRALQEPRSPDRRIGH
jgi:hypothetical protein